MQPTKKTEVALIFVLRLGQPTTNTFAKLGYIDSKSDQNIVALALIVKYLSNITLLSPTPTSWTENCAAISLRKKPRGAAAMVFYLRKNPRFGLVWLSVLGLIATLHSSPAHAYTIVGQDTYYHGGSLQFEILPYGATFTNQLVNYGYNHSAVIGFEDIFRRGDLDYDDAVLKVWGDIGVAHILEPSRMLMLGSGFLCLAYVLRFKKTFTLRLAMDL